MSNSFWVKTVLLLAFALILKPTTTFSQSPAQTPSVVYQFYNAMKQFCFAKDDDEEDDLSEMIKSCILGKEDSGINFPNDFKYWGYNTSENTINGNLYALKLGEYIYEKTRIERVEYKIIASTKLPEIEFGGKMKPGFSPSDFIITVTSRTFEGSGIKKTFSDSVYVGKRQVIEVLRNGINNEVEEDVNVLLALAANATSEGQYTKAFSLYRKIIKLDPQNSNAYYRLGLMCFYGRGCTPNREKALNYLEKARTLGNKDAYTVYINIKYKRTL